MKSLKINESKKFSHLEINLLFPKSLILLKKIFDNKIRLTI